MSRALFYGNPKMKTAREIVKKLKQQGVNAELCKKASTH